jgi:hypothetical protein
MAAERAALDENSKWVMMGVTNDASLFPTMLRVDPSTKRLLVDAGSITTSAANVGATGAAVPTSAAYNGLLDGSGNLIGEKQVVNATDSAGAGIQAVGMLAQFDNVAPTAITENQFGNLRMSNNRNLFVNIRDNAGNERGLNIDTSGQLAVTIAASQTVGLVAGSALVGKFGLDQTTPGTTNAIAIAQINAATTLAGNGATGTGSLRVTNASDNSAIALWGHGATGAAVPANAVLNGISDAGTMRAILQAANALDSTGTGIPTAQLVGQFDDVTPGTVTENRFGNIRMSVRREIYGQIRDAAGNERGANVNASNELVTGGGIAHDGADSGNPLKLGLYATTTNRTRVASADRVDAIADTAGRQVSVLGQVRDLRGKQTTTISASTSETTIVTAAASTFNDLVALVISNTSATAARVDIRDTTAGSVLFSLYIPAGDMRGFSLSGFSIPQTTVNTNWTAQSSASVTDLRVLAIFEKNI